jgi:hypothetical protein
MLKRTLILAGALAAVAAPAASSRVADGPHMPSPSAASRGAESAVPSKADMAARREAIAIKQWQAANRPTIIEVSPHDGDGGLDLPSAAIGAAVPLTLVVIEVAGRWVLRRRRENHVPHQIA